MARFFLLALLAWWTVGFTVHPLNGEFIGASFLHLINLPFHEAGHILFSPFGAFMTAFGGSLMQLLIPLVCVISFIRREDGFAAAVCAWWAGQNLIDLAPYIADARALQLVLLGGHTGAEVEGHDWEAILTSLGWLGYDRTLGNAAHWIGALTMVGAIGVAGWITLGLRNQASGLRAGQGDSPQESGPRPRGWARSPLTCLPGLKPRPTSLRIPSPACPAVALAKAEVPGISPTPADDGIRPRAR